MYQMNSLQASFARLDAADAAARSAGKPAQKGAAQKAQAMKRTTKKVERQVKAYQPAQPEKPTYAKMAARENRTFAKMAEGVNKPSPTWVVSGKNTRAKWYNAPEAGVQKPVEKAQKAPQKEVSGRREFTLGDLLPSSTSEKIEEIVESDRQYMLGVQAAKEAAEKSKARNQRIQMAEAEKAPSPNPRPLLLLESTEMVDRRAAREAAQARREAAERDAILRAQQAADNARAEEAQRSADRVAQRELLEADEARVLAREALDNVDLDSLEDDSPRVELEVRPDSDPTTLEEEWNPTKDGFTPLATPQTGLMGRVKAYLSSPEAKQTAKKVAFYALGALIATVITGALGAGLPWAIGASAITFVALAALGYVKHIYDNWDPVDDYDM